MLYSFLVHVVSVFLNIFSGRARIYNRENLPKGNYIIVAPHRTWMDPVLLAMAIYPKKFSFMAKKELFEKPIASRFLRALNAYPVDRLHPGMAAVRTPVKILKTTNLSTIIFPSGSRYSTKLKSGAALIAKLAGVPLVPAVYQGPLTFGGLMKHGRRHIAFGKPIEIPKKGRLDDKAQKEIEDEMQQAFDDLDKQINPDYHYVVPPKPKDDHF